jgi:hypothetical protein
MKMPDSWKNLWNDDGFITSLTLLIKTMNGIASLILLGMVIWMPYILVIEIISWFV